MKRMIVDDTKNLIEMNKVQLTALERGTLPKKIHHYTSIEVLKDYIFLKKSLQLSRLDKVNDLNEGRVSNIDSINNMQIHNTFIGCFQESDDENIPMWCIYARDRSRMFEEGIRHGIRLTLDTEELIKSINSKLFLDSESRIIPAKCTQELLDSNTPFILNTRLIKVNYDDVVVSNDDVIYMSQGEKKTEEESLVHYNAGGQLYGMLNGQLTGTYKKQVWAYENEIRIIVSMIENVYNPNGHINQEINYENIYLPLSEFLLNSCIITVNPFICEDEFNSLTKMLLDEFTWLKSEQIIPSCITSEIRMN